MDNEILIELIQTELPTPNSIYEPEFFEQKKKVFATEKSVRQNEFFQAHANGFKPEIVLVVNSFEYNNEEFCIYKGKRFKIYRAFTPSNTERTELYLTDVVGGSNVTSAGC